MKLGTILLTLHVAGCVLVEISCITNQEFLELVKDYTEDGESFDNDDTAVGVEDGSDVIDLPGNANDELDVEYLLKKLETANELQNDKEESLDIDPFAEDMDELSDLSADSVDELDDSPADTDGELDKEDLLIKLDPATGVEENSEESLDIDPFTENMDELRDLSADTVDELDDDPADTDGELDIEDLLIKLDPATGVEENSEESLDIDPFAENMDELRDLSADTVDELDDDPADTDGELDIEDLLIKLDPATGVEENSEADSFDDDDDIDFDDEDVFELPIDTDDDVDINELQLASRLKEPEKASRNGKLGFWRRAMRIIRHVRHVVRHIRHFIPSHRHHGGGESRRYSRYRRYSRGGSTRRYSRGRSSTRRYSRGRSTRRYSRGRSSSRRYSRGRSSTRRYSRGRSTRRYSRGRSSSRRYSRGRSSRRYSRGRSSRRYSRGRRYSRSGRSRRRSRRYGRRFTPKTSVLTSEAMPASPRPASLTENLRSLGSRRSFGNCSIKKTFRINLLQRFRVRIKACVRVVYLPESQSFRLTISNNDTPMVDAEVDPRNPTPLCYGVPGLRTSVRTCVGIYNINPKSQSMCLRLTASIPKQVKDSRYAMSLGCVHLPTAEGLKGANVTKLLESLQKSIETTETGQYEEVSLPDLSTIYSQSQLDSAVKNENLPLESREFQEFNPEVEVGEIPEVNDGESQELRFASEE